MRSWKSPSSNEIPRMEGFFFEINHALSNAISAIGMNDIAAALKQMKRFRALIRPSGIFEKTPPDEQMMNMNSDKQIRQILSLCDEIIRRLEQAKLGSKLDLKGILLNLSSLVFSLNKYYMYAKTEVCFAGSYKPAFEVFAQERIE